MTNRYTNAEWLEMTKQAERNLPNTHVEYKAVSILSEDFAKVIDHTLLKIDATKEQIDQLCNEARVHNFKCVCVRLKWVDRAVQNLRGSTVLVACVVGFPEGTYTVSQKFGEARDAVAAGASEIDMVLNYELLKQGDFSSIYTELATVRQAVRQTAPGQITLKVILETSQLSHSEIIAGCIIAEAAKIDFVKTSTGFKGGGATEEHVNLMRKAVGDRLKVKASGGIKTVKDCITMMEAGANRIGTSNGVWIMEEAKALMDQLTHDAGGNGLDRRPSVPTTRLFYS